MQANTANRRFHPAVTNGTKPMMAKAIMSQIMASLWVDLAGARGRDRSKGREHVGTAVRDDGIVGHNHNCFPLRSQLVQEIQNDRAVVRIQ